MYVYVKFIQDGVTYVTTADKVKKFKVDDYKENKYKKYKVQYTDGEFYKAYVVSVGASAEEAEKEATKKRFNFPPSRYADTDESTAAEDDTGIVPVLPVALPNTSRKQRTNETAVFNYERILKRRENRDLEENDVILKENSKLKKEIEILKKEIEKLKMANTELSELNVALQKTIVNELKVIAETVNSFPNVVLEHQVEREPEMAGVGQRRNKKVHLGRGIWIEETLYDSAFLKNDSVFIKDLAVAIFGTATLVKSSISGNCSNRYKEKDNKKEKLDPTKLAAIHDIVKYRSESRGDSKEKTELLLKQVNEKIRIKIQDLMKASRKNQWTGGNANENEDRLPEGENTEENMFAMEADENTENDYKISEETSIVFDAAAVLYNL